MDAGIPPAAAAAAAASSGSEAGAELRRPFSRYKRKESKRVRPSTSASPSRPQTHPSVFSVRPNPSHYITSFAPNSPSVEQRAVSALVERSRRAVCLVGLPGAGKTVALRAVAHQPAVHAMFRDAVALLGLAAATTADSLVADLCELVGRIAGARPRQDIEHMLAKNRSHLAAVSAAANALRDRRVLLLLDNVCACSGGPVLQLVVHLVKAATKGDNGRLAVLATARSYNVARMLAGEEVQPVLLVPPSGEMARAIICAHLGFDRGSFEEGCRRVGNSVVPVLERCAGLPLALAVAGGAVKRLMIGSNSVEAREVIWSHYKTYLLSNFEQFGEISQLFANLSACVDDVQNWPLTMPVRDALAKLGGMQTGVWIPWTVLQKLWNVPLPKGVLAAIDALAMQCLVTRECDKNNEVGIKIPAIVLDYCKHLARLLTKGRKKQGMVVGEAKKTVPAVPPPGLAEKAPPAGVVAPTSNGGMSAQKLGNGVRKVSAGGIRKPGAASRISEQLNNAGNMPAKRRVNTSSAVDPLMLHFTGAAQAYQEAQGEKDS